MVWTFCVNRTLSQSFYTKKLGKISVFYAVESIFLLYLARVPLTFSKIKIICVDGDTSKFTFTDKQKTGISFTIRWMDARKKFK